MSNGADSDSRWGTLINPDKSPAPLLEQLCLGIAQLMVSQFYNPRRMQTDNDSPYLQPSFCAGGSADLTPERLAAFYRKVGGNYDALFLETKSQALSFIYQSLGSSNHPQTLTNPPSTPSLLPNGFVRWQTIQLLMDPDEHSRYLQNAVSLWNLTDANGEPFPKEIPRDAFPSEPDPEMLQWHEGVSKRLEYDYVQRNTPRPCSPNPGGYYGHGSKDYGDDYFSHMPRGSGRRRSHFDSLGSRRRARKPHPAFNPPPNEPRSGFASPRVPTPPPWPERPPRKSRDRTAWAGRSVSPSTRDADDASAESSTDSVDESLREKKSRDKRNLSPPAASRARRHSHDAYTRKPVRDLSPAAPRRQRRSHGSRSSKSQIFEERPRSKPPGVKFREYIFDDPVPPPAREFPYPQGPAPSPPAPPPPPRYLPRHRNLDPYDETRRMSYSGGSGSGSRPGSGGGSSSERPRSYSNAGLHSRLSRRTSPIRSSAAKRYIPTSVAEDDAYMGPRRAPVYD
ncbi:hypothetical protein N7510_010377 [Penicillium lagena]|uniref:uncharacterized protein n=1 Tax=Penicillium lagena TaxID=94218 RepID=UPI002541EF27|nr:uncharacterized protein N7510_010377 [Penicillium lagena]KAJ5605223.1 hypothetical protein N7510_010377 [Penicillium lagena]